MASLQSWQGGYPALANLNFGAANLGGSDLSSGWNFSGLDTSRNPVAASLDPTGSAAALGAVGGAQTGALAGTGFGLNMNTLQGGLGGLQTIGSLWNAFNANSLARKQFNFTKDITNTNLNNSIQSYNTALADRARARAVMEGQTASERDAYIAANSLSR